MKALLMRFVPFLVFGIIIVLFFISLVLLSYLLLFGAVIGVVMFIVASIREKFFRNRCIKESPTGRTFLQ